MTIKQRTPSDCYVCSMAMALGLTYEEFISKVPTRALQNINGEGCRASMKRVLYRVHNLRRDRDYLHLRIGPEWINRGALKNFLWARRAIVTAMSKNHWDGTHATYWDGETLHDPSNKPTYKGFDDLDPIDITIFREHTPKGIISQECGPDVPASCF